MARTVSDLAKDLGLSSHDVLEVCAEEGIEADGHASVLSPDEESLIVDMLLAESVKKPKKKLQKKVKGKTKVQKKVKKEPEPEPEPEPPKKKVVKKIIKKIRRVVRRPADQASVEEPALAETEAAEAAEAPEAAPAEPTVAETLEAEAPETAAEQPTEQPTEKPKLAVEEKPAGEETPDITTTPRRRGAKIVGRAPETVLREIRAAAEQKADRGKLVEKLMTKSKVTPAGPGSRKRRRAGEEEEEAVPAAGAKPRGGKKEQAPRKVMRKILREGGEIGGATAGKPRKGGETQPLRRAQTKVFRPSRRGRGGPQRAPREKVRKTEATVGMPATAKDVSTALGIRVNDIIRTAMQSGAMITINDPMPRELIELIALEYEVEVAFTAQVDTEVELETELEREDKPEDMTGRCPVVTMLGHVDHGKTSLLDAIRKTDVVSGEAGGITQHIGASRVKTPSGNEITFLDTPGHAAFTQMRARGANITDIVVLVVAADDGVMPQTEEAIAHAKAAGVPVVVAVNKMDLPSANIDRVKQQVSRFDLIPEEWGGHTQFVPVSAVKGEGIDDLLERIALEAEILELKANPDKPALGRVIEAEVDPQSGVEVTLLVQGGMLQSGDVVLAGSAYGRVRYLMDHRGKIIKKAGPSTAVRVFGFNDAPEAGEKFWVVPDVEKARSIAETRQARKRERAQQQRKLVSLETLFDAIQAGEREELLFILKGDVQGSIEVLTKSLIELSTDEVRVRILHAGLGPVSESDVVLAEASEAIILGFHVMAPDAIRKLARERGVEIRLYDIIYQLIDDAKAALIGMHKPIERETVDGHAEVRDLFKVSRLGTIAGCYVTDGVIERNHPVRVFRDGVQVYAGKLSSLKRFKDDARSVRDGFECGMRIDGFDDVKQGDVIESYHVEEVAQEL